MEKKRNKCDAAIRQAIIDCLEKHLSDTDIQTAYPGILRAIKEWVWECELPTIDGKGTSTYQDVLDSLRTYFKDGFEEDRWWNSTHVLWALKNVLAVPSGDTGTNVGNADLISRQDAIDAARHAWAKGLEPTQFLEELPSAQPDAPDTNVGDMISRQAAIDAVKHAWAKGLEPSQYIEELPPAQPETSQVARDIATIIENEKDMRVIAQPEIIRCKDCKYFIKDHGWNCIEYMVCSISPIHKVIRQPDDFCSRAERRKK